MEMHGQKTEIKSNANADGLKESMQPSGNTPQQMEIASILGTVSALMIDSPMHQHFFLADMKWLVIPPIHLRQFRIFRRDNHPFAYVSWAMLSEEGGERLKQGNHRLRPGEWNSGDQAWIIDLIAPFGGHEDVLKDLKRNVFQDTKVRVLQMAPDKSGLAVTEW
ncbi:MAG: toxin-activating lysine-acyltransferase [Desulfomicrobium sp.]